MGMTMTEKILARAGGVDSVAPGDYIVVKVDTAMVLDIGFYPGFFNWPTSLHDADAVVVIQDHIAPAKDVQSAGALQAGRAFAEYYGVERIHDVGGEQGISHQLAADHGYARPGRVLVSVDSHTCSGGAYNCAARGLGHADMTYVLATGQTWFEVAPTVRYILTGSLPHGAQAKDVLLYIADRWGDHTGLNIEFGGPAQATWSLDARRTLSTMCAEVSADFAIWEPDDILLEHVQRVTSESFEPTYPDLDAAYHDVRTIELSKVPPYVAMPDSVVNNTMPVGELDGHIRLDQCFVGSCANGTLDDLRTVAHILSGRRVHPDIRFIVTPSSQRVYREALSLGYIDTIVGAGALVTHSACGACGGLDLGVLAAHEVCLTSSTRNFRGRMGSNEAQIYIASSATVAASAVVGAITDPAAYMEGWQ